MWKEVALHVWFIRQSQKYNEEKNNAMAIRIMFVSALPDWKIYCDDHSSLLIWVYLTKISQPSFNLKTK